MAVLISRHTLKVQTAAVSSVASMLSVHSLHTVLALLRWPRYHRCHTPVLGVFCPQLSPRLLTVSLLVSIVHYHCPHCHQWESLGIPPPVINTWLPVSHLSHRPGALLSLSAPAHYTSQPVHFLWAWRLTHNKVTYFQCHKLPPPMGLSTLALPD